MNYKDQFTDSARSVDDATLDRIEKKLQFAFPKEMREFYLTCNGGYPKRRDLMNDDFETIVDYFFPVKYDKGEGTFEGVCKDLRNDDRLIPWHLVPFANDLGGDFFCFTIDPADAGAIYFYAGTDIPDDKPDIIKVAESFPEFIEKLEEEKPLDGDDD